MRLNFAFFLFLCTFSPQSSFAVVIQILHTNDLHSHLEHATDPKLGGYASVKTAMESLKKDAAAKGIETISLDAGDFSEGSQFYLANRGREVFKIMNQMGYDAVTLGNHDWLMGPNELNQVCKEVPPNYAFLSANFIPAKGYACLEKTLKPSTIVKRSGIRIAIIGLSTNDPFYVWANKEGKITNPLKTAKSITTELRKNSDVIIALTHLGKRKDIKLAKRDSNIDIIVGGHSHSALFAPRFVKSKGGKWIPVVQAGQHGEYIGKILLDVKKGLQPEIISYEIIPVKKGRTNENHEMSILVESVRSELENEYGRAWLSEPIAYSPYPLDHPNKTETYYGELVTEAMRNATSADFALNSWAFTGISQPAGFINREQIILLYPRMFEVGKRLGWNVFTSFVNGELLNLIRAKWIKSFLPLSMTGRDHFEPGKVYKVALPEGIIKGADGISPLLRILLQSPKDTGIPMWTAIEQELKRRE